MFSSQMYLDDQIHNSPFDHDAIKESLGSKLICQANPYVIDVKIYCYAYIWVMIWKLFLSRMFDHVATLKEIF